MSKELDAASAAVLEEVRAKAGKKPQKPQKPQRLARRQSRRKGKLAFLEKYKRKDYHYHLANDVDMRIECLLENGWEFVLKEDGTKVGVSKAGYDDTGNKFKAFLMCIPKELYAEVEQDNEIRCLEYEEIMGYDPALTNDTLLLGSR